MQSAPQNELQLMTSCSKKKAEAIIAARPFKGWIDLVGLSKQSQFYYLIANLF